MNDDDNKLKTFDKNDVTETFLKTGGKGGQHRNKVESAVRLVHEPTGITVVSDGERRQGQNRARAWELLEEKIEYMNSNMSGIQVNTDRVSGFARERVWKWTEWRDEVVSPEGKKFNYARALKNISRLIS